MAKTLQKTSSRAVALGAGTTTTSIRFGIILDVNGTSVPVTSEDVSNALKNGVEFTLQEPITLGSIEDFENWVGPKFGVTLPKASDLPAPLDAVVGAITGMVVTVQKAHIKVPGKGSTDSVAYTLETNGTFQPEISLIQDKLGIQGMVFGFSNEPAES
jgi:hypothetical protein